MMYNFFSALDLQNLTLYDQRKYQNSCCGDFKQNDQFLHINVMNTASFNPYPTAFLYGNSMVLHFYQQQESSMIKTVHKVINKGLKAYV